MSACVVRILLVVTVLAAIFSCPAQPRAGASDAASAQPAPATVTFTQDFPAWDPSHYVISVARDGHATYACNLQLKMLEFTVSDRIRDQIFNLAQRAHYFSGKLDSGHNDLAKSGNKTLAYKDGQHDSQATYIDSTSPPVEQLTRIFQELSQTLEFGRRLAFSFKYQKTALDEELKRMEYLQRLNSLGDVQAIAPILKEIAGDPSVMNVSRERALRLIAAGPK